MQLITLYNPAVSRDYTCDFLQRLATRIPQTCSVTEVELHNAICLLRSSSATLLS